MAARFIQLLFISCNVWIILHVCSLHGVNCDVPDGVVYTDLHKTAKKGDELVMKCQFYGTPIAVYWKKGYEPTKSPNLITWVEGESASGSCVHDGSCHMSVDFSLIIRNVTVSDQGTYICRVSNYKGILIHNFTEVNVFAPPMEPFPLIDECRRILPNDSEQTCSLSTSNIITITCSASGYFPDIDLFFLHESKKMNATNIKEFANMDGTKNKSISTLAEPSESPYVCVASDIPGPQDQRTKTVTVTFLGSIVAVTTSSIQTTITSNGGVAKKVVVPVTVVILILAAICVAILLWRRRKQQRNQERDPESVLLRPEPKIKGKVSFFELWYLVHNMDKTNLKKLRDALINLGIPGVEEELTEDRAYDLLCEWKDTNTFDNEGVRLKNTFKDYALDKSWQDACERRYDTETLVSEELLGHVLWSIGDETRIRQFLRKLINEKSETRFNVSGNTGDVIEEFMVILRKWRDRAQAKSKVIQLSLALERAKCKPLDRTFFKIPEQLLKAISQQEVEGFVYRLTGRHCKRIAKEVGITDEKKIATIMDKNNEDLVLIQSVVNDWLDGQECCDFEKRCRLDDATIKIGRHDMTDAFGTTSHREKTADVLERQHPYAKTFTFKDQGNDYLGNDLSDAELRGIVQYLGRAQLTNMFGEHAEGDSCNTIKVWVERESSAGQPVSCRQRLRAKLSPIGMEDLIPLAVKEDVYLVELVDIAFRLLMMDIYPLAEALGISTDKLKSNKRKSLNKTKLSSGTMGVLVRLGEKTKFERSKLCDALARGAGWQEMAHLLKYGYELSHGDLCAVGYGDGSKKEQCAKIRENLGRITEGTDTMDMLRHWRALVKPPTYNPRTGLADAVFPVLGKEKALDIISGKIRNSGIQKGNVVPFIRDTIQYVQAFSIASILGVQHSSSESSTLTIKQVIEIWQESLKSEPLKDNQRGELCKRLDDGGFKTFSSKLRHEEHQHIENGCVLKEIINAILCDVVSRLAEILGVKSVKGTSSIRQVIEDWEEKIRKKPLKEQERLLLSNAILEEGYRDFSLEIMTGSVLKPGKSEEEANVGLKSAIRSPLQSIPALDTQSFLP